jgi:transcription elongation factor GreA
MLGHMADEKKIEMTQAAFDKIRAELLDREGPRRERIVNDIATARAHGDLSENAEYHAAREEQGQNEAKIRQLRFKVEHAEIIEATEDGVVRPGMVVTIRHEGDDESETYLIGQRGETEEYDVLTPESPIGRALMGRSEGETAVAEVPAGELKIEILTVTAP